MDVTPCMGVWIETAIILLIVRITRSHPVWVCGLKPYLKRKFTSINFVTPCMGVWIETVYVHIVNFNFVSHPVWVCGLKRAKYQSAHYLCTSHPVWVCGLKL